MEFVMFSAAHWAGLAGLGAAVAAIFAFRGSLGKPSVLPAARRLFAALLLLCEASLQVWYVLSDRWNADSLPLQLCSLTLLLSAAALLLPGRRALNEIVFFLGTLGALQALLTPSLDYTFPHFRYFHFFAAHIGIVGAAVFLFAVESYRPRFRSAARAFGWLHLLALPAAAANAALGTNFMFLARKPATASLLDLLAPWPWYLLELEAVAALLLLLLYASARVGERLAGRAPKSEENLHL